MSVPGLVCVEHFITEQEERELIEFVYKQEWNKSLKRWTQHYGFEYCYDKPSLLKRAHEIPLEFKRILEKFKQLSEIPELQFYEFDQVIVNRYLPGEGISAHVDHKENFGDKIVSVSLGSDCMMVLTEVKNKENSIKKLLKRRSLILLSGESRNAYTHMIPSRKSDDIELDGKIKRIKRSERISLTFRKVNQNRIMTE